MNVITINNLAAHISETDLTKLFEPFGSIIRIKLTRKHDQKTRSIEGIAQVIFVSGESAIAAARHMHGYMLMGRQLIIRQDAPLPKTSQPSQGVKNSIHVRFTTSNIDQTVSKMDLMRIFSPFGDINDVVIKASSIDHLAHHQSGYGFVDFCNRPEGLTAAVKAVQGIHNRCIDGINFHVELSRNIMKRLESSQPVHMPQQLNPQFYASQPSYTSPHPEAGAYFPYPTSQSSFPAYAPQQARQVPMYAASHYSLYCPPQVPTELHYSQSAHRPPRPMHQAPHSYEALLTPAAPMAQTSPSQHSSPALTSDRLNRHNRDHAHHSSRYSAYAPPSLPSPVPSVIQNAQVNGDNQSVSSVSSRTTVVSADYQFGQASSPTLVPQVHPCASPVVSSSEVPASKFCELLGWTSRIPASAPVMHPSLVPVASSSSSHAWLGAKGGMYISEDRMEESDAFNLSKFTLSILSFDHAI